MSTKNAYDGARVTVMGLGLHGGGAATVRYLHSQGATLTVTDLRSPEELRPSIEALSDISVRYVLGTHNPADFRNAEFVVKNPGVPRSSPYLQEARRIETDISLFLRAATNPLLTVTGTKGKSTTATALHYILTQAATGAALGGNITVSPLAFLETLRPGVPVVLELSSFQLGDLQLAGALELLRPQVSILTALMPDHLNYYPDMASYIQDKMYMLAATPPENWAVLSCGEAYLDICMRATKARLCVAGHPALPPTAPMPRNPAANCYLEQQRGYLKQSMGRPECIMHSSPLPGAHARANLLAAAAAARLYGVGAALIEQSLTTFPGVAHRMEFVTRIGGVRYFNDSAATIAEAAVAAVEAFEEPVHLIAGGSGKQLSLQAFGALEGRSTQVYLLAGSATAELQQVLEGAQLPVHGPFASLETAFAQAHRQAQPGEVVVLSPGCASFGMFMNEFDRGNQFRELVLQAATQEKNE